MHEKQQVHLQLSKFLLKKKTESNTASKFLKHQCYIRVENTYSKLKISLPAHITKPPASSIRCRSSVWSGLWSRETAIAEAKKKVLLAYSGLGKISKKHSKQTILQTIDLPQGWTTNKWLKRSSYKATYTTHVLYFPKTVTFWTDWSTSTSQWENS